MLKDHLHPDRVSSLFFANQHLSPPERLHVKTCKKFNDRLTALAKIAADTKVGKVFDVPPLERSSPI